MLTPSEEAFRGRGCVPCNFPGSAGGRLPHRRGAQSTATPLPQWQEGSRPGRKSPAEGNQGGQAGTAPSEEVIITLSPSHPPLRHEAPLGCASPVQPRGLCISVSPRSVPVIPSTSLVEFLRHVRWHCEHKNEKQRKRQATSRHPHEVFIPQEQKRLPPIRTAFLYRYALM